MKWFKLFYISSWVIFIIVTLFCFYYPFEIAVYSNHIDKLFAPVEWFFIWLMVAGLWVIIHYLIIDYGA